MLLLNSSMEQTQQNKPLTEESLAQMMYEKLNEAYRKGYNTACDVLSQVIMQHSAEFGDPKIKMVVEGLAITIKKCYLREDCEHLVGTGEMNNE